MSLDCVRSNASSASHAAALAAESSAIARERSAARAARYGLRVDLLADGSGAYGEFALVVHLGVRVRRGAEAPAPTHPLVPGNALDPTKAS